MTRYLRLGGDGGRGGEAARRSRGCSEHSCPKGDRGAPRPTRSCAARTDVNVPTAVSSATGRTPRLSFAGISPYSASRASRGCGTRCAVLGVAQHPARWPTVCKGITPTRMTTRSCVARSRPRVRGGVLGAPGHQQVDRVVIESSWGGARRSCRAWAIRPHRGGKAKGRVLRYDVATRQWCRVRLREGGSTRSRCRKSQTRVRRGNRRDVAAVVASRKHTDTGDVEGDLRHAAAVIGLHRATGDRDSTEPAHRGTPVALAQKTSSAAGVPAVSGSSSGADAPIRSTAMPPRSAGGWVAGNAVTVSRDTGARRCNSSVHRPWSPGGLDEKCAETDLLRCRKAATARARSRPG